MTEGEPKLGNRPNPVVENFFKVLDETVGKIEQTGETGITLMPQDKRDELNTIATLINEIFNKQKNRLVYDYEYLINFLKENYGIELKSNPKDQSGFYKTLHVVSGERLGRSSEQQKKAGFKLVLAIIPKGHTAPAHIHRDLTLKTGFGELTSTLEGTLQYVGRGGKLEKHTKNDKPRLSPDGSPDIYLTQEDLWVGFYIQPENCDIPQGEVAEMINRTRLLAERALNTLVYLGYGKESLALVK